MRESVNIFWFRRDLRLEDNCGMHHALSAGLPVLPLFIFDSNILQPLDRDDPRVSFIYAQLQLMHEKLIRQGSGLWIEQGDPVMVFKNLAQQFNLHAVYTNRDYEPYAISRDNLIAGLLKERNVRFYSYKDQVIFEKGEVLKDNGEPYTVFTPYSRKWLQLFKEELANPFDCVKTKGSYLKKAFRPLPPLNEIGFSNSPVTVPEYRLDENLIARYAANRNFPSAEGTSHLGPHLRFGTISIRQVIRKALNPDRTFLLELVWREFFMQILAHFPRVVNNSFKPAYNRVNWLNDEKLFSCWCDGLTGYPLVDAGMRELSATGFMHNRVRMVTASFLCKHLLIDWRWGESWFARKLLDYELASNNGNWQWAAGTGCDAAPYFRVFNPEEQLRKFDPELKYVRRWVPEFGTRSYPLPVVDHKSARLRAIAAYRKALQP